MSSEHSMYITLQYLRTVNKQNKYHWGLWITGSEPPKGHLVHATDANRAALDLYKESRKVKDPLRSKSMVACLKIANSPGVQAVDAAADSVGLMDMRFLPRGEVQWTCRVFVKEVLNKLHQTQYIDLPVDVDTIESYCQVTADYCWKYGLNGKVYNDLSWLSSTSQTTPMDIDTDINYTTQGRYLGPSPMDTETYGRPYYGSSPMITETATGGYYLSSSARTKPMVTETHTGSRRRGQYSSH